jgi:hypothetical protein
LKTFHLDYSAIKGYYSGEKQPIIMAALADFTGLYVWIRPLKSAKDGFQICEGLL